MKVRLGIGLASLLMLSACGEEPQQKGAQSGTETTPQILAHVNDSPITSDEFEVARSRFNAPDFMLDAKFDQTLLQSLVNSRAMALLVQEEMDAEAMKMVELKAAAYREELLVKAYLKRHATPSPVTQERVENYYREHPEEFSGGSRKEFEYFSSTRSELGEEERRRILGLLSAAKGAPNWEVVLESEAGLPLAYRRAKARVEVLEEPLKTLVAATPPGEVSSVHVGEKLLLVRVISEQQLTARPLSEVAGEIRQRLAPMQLRKAIKEVSREALGQVSVKYADATGQE